MSTKETLQSIIENFDLTKFETFFRGKNNFLNFPNEPSGFIDNNFTDGIKLAEGNLEDGNLVVYAFKSLKGLSERSSKKDQYTLGKKVLKGEEADSGIFIFYDDKGRFRFSLIYVDYSGTRREFSTFKRFTYFVSKEQTNKTFLKQIGEGDLSTIRNIKEAFSVDKVTKEFYTEIANWYFWAMDKVRFPEDHKYSDNPKKDKELRQSTNLIRLITRIIFIWFLKEKDLIPNDLFSKSKLKTIVKDFMKNKSSSNFYNAILQNLFFATLNQKMNERDFAEDKDYPENRNTYGVKNLYRYEDKFLISREEVLGLFKDVPFLNGGLFDCLDKMDDTGKVIYIDGFSRNLSKQTVIPDYLFFEEKEQKVDLSSYGVGSNKSVRGLIEILNSYNFTIDENTPIDKEVALDPELLGKVFENLLASYNPETATTARKATGSYYTPREIVDYMVETSLIEYLKEKLPNIAEEKLKLLLSYSDEVLEFSEAEKQLIISAIDEIKVIDPACGSGAFPMGILQRLVYVLQKLDPANKYWYDLQSNKAVNESQEVFKWTDKNEREERLKEINEVFDENVNYPDYSRKLYLIENCIYGIDIQAIAVQISKLRFFISLVIDQRIDKTRENFGIRPLPNLETNFVAANTLIGLEIPQQDLLFQNTEVKQIQDELAKERHKYFNAKTRSEKIYYQKQDKILREKLAEKVEKYLTDIKKDEINQIKKTIKEEELKLQKVIQEPEDIEIIEQKTLFGEIEQIKIDKKKERIKAIKCNLKEHEKKLRNIQNQVEGDFVIKIAKKIAGFDLYDQNASADFFDPEWMFGIKDGYDVVIGNPPYIQLQKALNSKIKYADLYKDLNYETFDRVGDIYCLFYERGMQLLNPNGHLCYISSNKWMRAGYGEKLRRFFLKYNPKVLIDLGPNVFESSTVDTNILLIQKSENQKMLKAVTISEPKKTNVDIAEMLSNNGVILTHLSESPWFIGSYAEQRLKEKIERIGKPLKYWDVKIYRGILTGLNEAFIIDTAKREEILQNCKDTDERKRTEAIIKPILRGRDIKRYYYEWAGLWVIIIPAGWTNENRGRENPNVFIEKTFSSLMAHLKNYEADARKRDDQGDYWWELRQCAYYSEFEKEKIMLKNIGKNLAFTIVPPEMFNEASSFMITGKSIRYLLGFLNSSFMKYFIYTYSDRTGAGDIAIKGVFIEKFPVPYIVESNDIFAKRIEWLVNQITTLKKQNPQADTSTLEREIDQLVYKLYDLTSNEINIIESNIKKEE